MFIRDDLSLLLRKKQSLKVQYEQSVENCIVIVPVEKEMGAEISLYTLSPKDHIDFTDPMLSSTLCDVTVLAKGRFFHLSSDCLLLKEYSVSM